MSKTGSRPQTQQSRPWYAGGLRFRCMRCKRCCGGAPGYVWVTPEEIARLAESLGITIPDFTQKYCRSVWWRTSLTELANGDCVLLTSEGCSVYPVRPAQCGTFPFWKDNLRSIRRWEGLKLRCSGVGKGRLYTQEEIEQISERGRST